MQHTNMLRRFCVALVVGGKEKYEKTYELFKERQQQELYHCENSFFFFLLQIFLRRHGRKIFLFSLMICISIVPNFCLAFGTLLHKNMITLADVFPICCQWKDISV
jgi:hypothetical protein